VDSNKATFAEPTLQNYWLNALDIGEDQSDDPHGPFTPSEFALGRALYERTMFDRKCVAHNTFGHLNVDWNEVRVGQQFSWASAARELLRTAKEHLNAK
jgi:hypothetical protein